MTLIVFLFLIGLILFFFEVITPGGVLGVLGGLAMLGGCGYAFHTYGPAGGLVATVVAIAAIGGTLYFELVVLPKTKVGKQMFLHSAVVGTSQPPLADPTILGRDCKALTVLAPSGIVLLDGKKYEAFSRSGFVERGAALKVSSIDNFRLIVQKS